MERDRFHEAGESQHPRLAGAQKRLWGWSKMPMGIVHWAHGDGLFNDSLVALLGGGSSEHG